MKLKFFAVAALVALLVAVLAPVHPARAAGSITQQVHGTASNGRPFNGTLTITQFANQGGNLVARGTVTGTIPGSGSGSAPVTVPITSADPPACTILFLHTGEITLTLLGLTVDIQPITITITGQPGTVLGGLLCSLANLLSGGGPLGTLAALLNAILAALP